MRRTTGVDDPYWLWLRCCRFYGQFNSLFWWSQRGVLDAQEVSDEALFTRVEGHSLVKHLDEITENYYGGKSRPIIQAKHDFITKDKALRECMRIFSDFG